jgi:hypothetical protein
MQQSCSYCRWGERPHVAAPPFSPSGKLNMEAVAEKPKEDGCTSCHSLCVGGAFVHKALATSGLLVKKLLAVGSLLAFVGSTLVKEALGGTLVKKLLMTCGLLSLTSRFLVGKALGGRCLLAMVLILPQFVHGPLPVLVVGLLESGTSGKNCLPQWRRWQQPCGLFVFVSGTIEGSNFA